MGLDLDGIFMTVAFVVPGMLAVQLFSVVTHRTAPTRLAGLAYSLLTSMSIYGLFQILGCIDLGRLADSTGRPDRYVLLQTPNICFFFAVCSLGACGGALAGRFAISEKAGCLSNNLLGKTLDGNSWGPLAYRLTRNPTVAQVVLLDGTEYSGGVVVMSTRWESGVLCLHPFAVGSAEGGWSEYDQERTVVIRFDQIQSIRYEKMELEDGTGQSLLKRLQACFRLGNSNSSTEDDITPIADEFIGESSEQD